MRLKLAEDLSLPIEAATQTFLVVGKRGSGKSTTCVRLAEQLFKAGVPIVAIDPVDTWWGLKSSRDGKGPGLSLYVFGGQHADLPLQSASGALIADVIIEHHISAVLSIKHLSGRERTQLVSDFCLRIFQRNREPLHLFLEEAHEVAPQHTFKGEEEMLGRVTRIWKLGRSSGIGGSAITQRPASLNKNITTQAEILIVHRTIGPQDVAAIREWIRYHGEREDILAQLSTLKTGEAFVWAPDFPEGKPIGLKRVKILNRETFDSSATPKAGERRVEPKALAPVDLERLRTQMAATIEKAKAEDPRELRKQIVELKAQFSKAQTLPPTTIPQKETRVEVPILKDSHIKRLEQLGARLSNAGEAFLLFGKSLLETIAKTARNGSAPVSVVQTPVRRAFSPSPIPPKRSGGGVSVGFAGSSSQQRILNALAWFESIGIQIADKTQLAFLADQRPTSGGYFNNLGALRSNGLINYPSPGSVGLTSLGRSIAEPSDVPTTTEELHRQIFQKLSSSQVRILRALITVYPGDLSKEELAERSDQRPTSGGYFNNLGSLRSLGLIDYPVPGRCVAKDILFLAQVSR